MVKLRAIKQKHLKQKRNLLVFSIIIFLIIFNPPIIKDISFTKLFLIIAFGTCIIKNCLFEKIFFNRIIFNWIKIILFFYAYYMLAMAVNMLIYSDHMWSILIYYISSAGQMGCLFIIGIYMTIMGIQLKLSETEILNSYVIAGLWQAIMGIACFIFPPIKFFFNFLMASNSNSEKIAHYAMQTHRNFGFANQLYDGFGITMSILAIIALVCAIKGKKKYYLYAAMIAFVAFINARSSIGFLAAGVFVVFIYNKRIDTSEILGKVIIIVVGAILTGYLIQSVLTGSSESAVWISTGLEEIIGIFRGQRIGYFDTLINNFIFFPDTLLGNLIGTGATPMVMISKGTDVGYILNLWQYGIIGSAFIFFFYAYPIRKWGKKAKGSIANLPYAIGAMILVYMVKLNCFGYGQASVLVICIFIMEIYLEYGMDFNKRKEEIEEPRDLQLRYYVKGERIHDTSNECFKTI
ncbi:MAG: hypothetical protein HFI33_03145 [Lachnospiraceae bacterium]|nr:hypothetical protein [Lachnospiraceae bacterium]